MLPRATNTRSDREAVKGRVGGRTHEISRLIGRSLRAVIDTKELGENTLVLDCDVLQADGGTRTAAITGAYVALADAIAWAKAKGVVQGRPADRLGRGRERRDRRRHAGSGPLLRRGRPRRDRHERRRHRPRPVRRGAGHRRGRTVRPRELDALLDLATAGCADLTRLQAEALASPRPPGTRGDGPARPRDPQRAQGGRAARDPRRGARRRAGDRPRRRGRRRSTTSSPEVVESGVTFAENALLKARAAAAHSGLPAVADDSGLRGRRAGRRAGCLLGALGGPLRARADDDRANVDLLLAQARDVPDEHRGAGFVCAVALVLPDGTEVVEHGEVRGTLERVAARRRRVRLRPDAAG